MRFIIQIILKLHKESDFFLMYKYFPILLKLFPLS